VGAWGYLHGIDKIGARQITAGFVPTERHIELIKKTKPTIVITTVTGALVLAETAKSLGHDLRETSPWLIIPGAEPGASYPSVQGTISDAWAAEVGDVGTMSEMYPPETNTMCEERTGMHVYQDEIYTEIVDKENTNALIPFGTNGVVVYTHLYRESQPMIRLWSGDESLMVDDPCPCGRTYPLLPKGILGRVDDMLIIRGVNIYPSAIEDVLRSTAELGVEHRIIVEKRKSLDELSIVSNCTQEFYAGLDPARKDESMAELGEAVAKSLRTAFGIRISVDIKPPDTLESTGLKARRVIDKRPQLG
jgi:phenylacetate-CoA ligase